MRASCYRSALEWLEAHELTFGDLVVYVSNPENWQGSRRYWGFFSVQGRVEQVLDWWTSSRNSTTGRTSVHTWAVEYAATVVRAEGSAATRSKFLQAEKMEISREFALGFTLEKFHAKLLELCPTAMALFTAFSSTHKQLSSDSASAIKRKENALIGLGARSQKNSFARHVLGLYAYAEGAHRQVISVLSHLGITSSYPALTGRLRSEDSTADSRPHDRTARANSSIRSGRSAGLLKLLADACMREARERARNSVLAHVWDNVNFLFKVAEQVIGRKDSQQNGTCATVFELFNAAPDDMQTSELVDSFAHAPELKIEDILLTPEENTALTERLEHTVLRIIVNHGGEGFARFRKDILDTTPSTADKIPLHQTEPMPLPAMNIDESSTTGNADVLTEIFSALGQDMSTPEFTRTVKILCGDQLSISRIRSLLANRAGHDSFAHSFLWAVCMPGLFHYKMAATHGIIEHHWGSSMTTPGSLWFNNTRLDRKPIVLSSLPPFRTCRDLIFVSLYACVLHCLSLVSECASPEDYAKNVSIEELRAHAKLIVARYANAQVAQKLRSQREAELRERESDIDGLDDDSETTPPAEDTATTHSGDMVFENAVLFLRDALVLREYNDAVKSGDSGRVLTVLKLWTSSFRGSGRTKYAHEMLHLIHNLTHVWPEPLRKIVMQNWLVNPTGKPDSWVEVDLMQEHINFWTKNIYKAHGSNASWEWLAKVSPAIDILRRLSAQINGTLGSRQGAKHTSPDLERDINELIDALAMDGGNALHQTRGPFDVPADDMDSDHEYWDGETDIDWAMAERDGSLFSLDSAADVALDMDDLSTL
ncbi:hypothetical protein C8Q76DRAFT_767461 [Earliella scabrosa]|nr:hypothetical protein C8Q76DRAFT_767461 [Earliella scabrosa]